VARDDVRYHPVVSPVLKPPPKLSPTRVAELDVERAHAHSIAHRDAIETSGVCGCFYCLAVFPPAAIEEWVDDVDGVLVTALCPECAIDSVIGSSSGYPIETSFLERMRRRWFE
jgi:hypothetical protein